MKKRFLHFVRKETLHILRDTRTLLVVIGIPIVLTLMFGFAISTDVNNVDIVISKLNENDLLDKHAVVDEDGDTMIPYGNKYHERIYFFGHDDDPVIYPYNKAIAQLVVHEVPIMNINEITYEELKTIPSNRGTGKLGSSNK